MKNNGDGTHTVHYTPAQDGPYAVAVKYAEQEVPHRYSISWEKGGKALAPCADMSSFNFPSASPDLKERVSSNFLLPLLSPVAPCFVITLDISLSCTVHSR